MLLPVCRLHLFCWVGVIFSYFQGHRRSQVALQCSVICCECNCKLSEHLLFFVCFDFFFFFWGGYGLHMNYYLIDFICTCISVLAFSISLEVMTLNPVCECVETSEGVPVTVTGVAQCKIMRAPDILKNACEQFLGKSSDHIQRVVLQTLEGHLRAILGMNYEMRNVASV